MSWVNNYVGLYLYGSHKKVDKALLKEVGFKFAWVALGDGLDRDPMSDVNIQIASDIGVPCFGVYRLDPELYLENKGGLDSTQWAQGEADLQMQTLKRQIFMASGAKRRIHGIILDCSKYKQNDGKLITGNWVRAVALFIYNAIWDTWKIPVYMYFSPASISNDKVVMETLIGSLVPKEGTDFRSLSLYQYALSTLVYNNLPYPVEAEKPQLYSAKDWYFWRYGTKIFSFITDNDNIPITVPLILYNGDMAKDLNFTYGTTTPETPNTDDETPTVPTSTDVLQKLDRLTELMEMEVQNTSTILSKINGVFK